MIAAEPAGVVLFGIGSSIVVEYEETCKRLGIAVAGIRNRPGPAYFHDEGTIVDAASIPPQLLRVPCVCPIFTPHNRLVAAEEARAAGFGFAEALIDPTAIVASSSRFGAGSFVNAGCIVGAQVLCAEHVVLNRGVTLGHHVEVGAFSSLGPSAVVGGWVEIGQGAMIGAGAVLLPKVRVGAHAIVGAGSVVVADVPPHAKVLGNPARITARSVAGL
ncbi:MAG: acetyltransferase [Candidatus Eremiobacteraeota bacterium]|nr:acetyltransferase [Candidatus Eremiobacteraeota bacterium]